MLSNSQYVTLDHKTSLKNRFIHHLKSELIDSDKKKRLFKKSEIRIDWFWCKKKIIEKFAFKVIQMKFLAKHITNQKLSFDKLW